MTTNKSMLFPFQGINGERSASVPSMRTAGEVLSVHRGRVARSLQPVARREIPTDWVAEYYAQGQGTLNAAVSAGVFEKVGAGDYRPSWCAALRFTLMSFELLRPILSLVIRINERRVLRGNPRGSLLEAPARLSR